MGKQLDDMYLHACGQKGAALKSLGEKSCVIKGGGQQMAAMVLMLTLHTSISINIITAICWPSPLISQLFSPRLFKAAPFSQLGCFWCGYHFFL